VWKQKRACIAKAILKRSMLEVSQHLTSNYSTET
jgi:hypothetical protein